MCACVFLLSTLGPTSLSYLSCRQVEDLQFQLEEQDVISGDKLEVVEEGTQAKLAQLEEQLAREREESATLRQQLQAQVHTGQLILELL